MNKIVPVFLIVLITFAASCKKDKMQIDDVKPPIADVVPKELESHGDVRIDNYYWLRLSDEQKNAENPDAHAKKVRDYLNSENDYFDKKLGHTEKFRADLYQEMKSRIKEDDESVPYKDNGYFYITRYVKDGQYPIYARKKETLEANEELIFDVNLMAEGHEYYRLGGLNVSPNNKIVAFAVDTISRRQYMLQFRNLETGEFYPEKIENTSGSSVWANDNTTVFYTKKNPGTLRAERIFKHVLGTDPVNDIEIYYEADDTYSTYVFKTKSNQFIAIGSSSTLTTEYQVLSADSPNDKFRIIQPRVKGLEYHISHFEDNFYIYTNKDKASNFKLMKTPIDKTSSDNWVDVIPHRADVLLEDISIFKDYLVLEERTNGLSKVRIKRWDGTTDEYLPFNEETYSVGVSNNPEFDTDTLRYAYNSFTTPASVIDYNMKDKFKEVKKEQEVLGGKFNKDNYTSKRIWVTARDGKKIAVSIVHRKDTKLGKNTPLLLYAYGSYGNTIPDGFSTTRLSLLDRGFVFALAHIRGSQYLGRQWYEDGKLFNKMNTFTDFIDCSKYLIENNYTSSDHLYAMGGSAGGLLMGAIVNMDAGLYNGIVAAVPFVDVVTTMLDETIPLTTFEYDEWGNPNEKEYYDYMLTYSPYDNVQKKTYPNMLITTGLHDSQVQYYEPAKWLAKLRANKTDDNLLVMHTDMESGHGGASGRFNALKDTARDYGFILEMEGIKE